MKIHPSLINLGAFEMRLEMCISSKWSTSLLRHSGLALRERKVPVYAAHSRVYQMTPRISKQDKSVVHSADSTNTITE